MKRSTLLAFFLCTGLVADSAWAGPPADGGRTPVQLDQGVGPPGAGFSPDTTGDAGLINGPPQQANDQVYGASERTVGGETVVGYSVVDTSEFLADDGVLATTPEFHVVEKGDTLWGICDTYYRDPYLWPKIWSYNDQITNAHWIFPGDRVRLTDPFDRPPEQIEAGPSLRFSVMDPERSHRPSSYTLNRFAYIEDGQLEQDMEVYGGAEAKVMMATLDTVYLSYDPANPPIAGERLAVYRPERRIRDLKLKGDREPKPDETIGYLVEVTGEVYVTRVSKKSAEAKIVSSTRPIERGMKVGELRTRFSRVEPVPSDVTDTGLVVDTVRDYELSGNYHFVISNLGASQGIRRGNVLEVVHKGDAYSKKHKLLTPYEEGHPRRLVGQVLVLEVQAESSIGVVIYSNREIEIGDHIEIRAGEMSETDQPSMDERKGMSGDANLDTQAGDGEVKAEGGFSFGN